MTAIQAEIIRALLIKQFNCDHFNIWHVDSCLKVSNTIPDREVYKQLSALHAVLYQHMSPTLRRWLIETCIGMFTGNGFAIESVDRILPPVLIDIKGEWVKNFIGSN